MGPQSARFKSAVQASLAIVPGSSPGLVIRFRKKAMRHAESALYEQLARYMRLQHPDVPFHFDLSGVNNQSVVSRGLYSRLNRRGWPDMFIPVSALMPATVLPYYGLFLELKPEGTRLKKRDGSWASPHLEEQAATLQMLQDKGYVAQFASGFDEAVMLIESYLEGSLSVDV